jgi:hypothetical protein
MIKYATVTWFIATDTEEELDYLIEKASDSCEDLGGEVMRVTKNYNKDWYVSLTCSVPVDWLAEATDGFQQRFARGKSDNPDVDGPSFKQ